MKHIVAKATSTPVSLAGARPVLAAVDPDLVVPVPVAPTQELHDTLYSPPRQGYSILQPGYVQSSDPADRSSGVIQFQQDRLRQAEFKSSGQGRALKDLSQAMVKLSCVTDDTCGSVNNTLQGVSNRLRRFSQYGIALVDTGGHKGMNKCSR